MINELLDEFEMQASSRLGIQFKLDRQKFRDVIQSSKIEEYQRFYKEAIHVPRNWQKIEVNANEFYYLYLKGIMKNPNARHSFWATFSKNPIQGSKELMELMKKCSNCLSLEGMFEEHHIREVEGENRTYKRSIPLVCIPFVRDKKLLMTYEQSHELCMVQTGGHLGPFDTKNRKISREKYFQSI